MCGCRCCRRRRAAAASAARDSGLGRRVRVCRTSSPLLSTLSLPLLNLTPKQDRRTLFNQWKAENGKKYANAKAENAAFATFSATVTDLVGHNSNGKNKFFKGECGWAR